MLVSIAFRYQVHSAPVILMGGITGVPHSSFFNPWACKTELPRESIEIRALVFSRDSLSDPNTPATRVPSAA